MLAIDSNTVNVLVLSRRSIRGGGALTWLRRDPAPIRDPARRDWTLGAIALFRPRKGLEILLEALADIILANGERPGRIHPRPRNQAITAGAVIGRRPATVPMPIVNTGECCRFIFLSESQSDSVHSVQQS